MDERIEIDQEAIGELLNVPKKDPHAPLTEELLCHELADELRRLTADMKLPKRDGTEGAPNIFEQLLPMHEKQSEQNKDFPYLLVKFIDSNVVNMGERQPVSIVIGIGIYYENEDRQYQHYAFHIFNVIKKRFIENNFLGNFRCDPDGFSFALSPDDEITYPRYFAAIGMTWQVPGISRVSSFS